MNIEWLPLSDLTPNPKNPNKHSKDQITRIQKLIEYYGWRHPIIVSKESGLIVVGHGRLEAAMKMGLDKVPVSIQSFESPEQEYGFLVADNAIASWAELDLKNINLEVPDLGPDFDIDLLGIKDFEIDAADKYQEGEDDVPDVGPAVSKLGDLFILGNHRLLCGDATDSAAVERLMNGEKADMVFTDPPYLPSNTRYGFEGFNGRNRKSIINCETDELAIKCYQSIPEANEIYVWSDFMSVSSLNFKPKDAIVWKKNNFGLGRGYRNQHEVCFYTGKFNGSDSDVWEVSKDLKTEHPTQKPVALAERAIKNSNPHLVVDLFLGSGSTLIACEKTNRKCFGMEIDPHYIDIIIARWEKFTVQKAVKLESNNRN